MSYPEFKVTREEKPCPSSVAGIVDPYIEELDKVNKTLDRYVSFLELTEALTTDPQTAKRIREFLIKEGIWK